MNIIQSITYLFGLHFEIVVSTVTVMHSRTGLCSDTVASCLSGAEVALDVFCEWVVLTALFCGPVKE